MKSPRHLFQTKHGEFPSSIERGFFKNGFHLPFQTAGYFTTMYLNRPLVSSWIVHLTNLMSDVKNTLFLMRRP